MVQKLERNGVGSDHQIAYVIGSGSHAVGFLTAVGNHLFQSPIAWYTKRGIWDVAPGYENASAPDFNRAVTPECLFFHAGRARPVRGTLNRYAILRSKPKLSPASDVMARPKRIYEIPFRAQSSIL